MYNQEDLVARNKALEKENQELRLELEKHETNIKKVSKIRMALIKQTAFLFLGWRLKASLRKLADEIEEGNVHRHTLSDVATHVFWRFTRIGLLALLIGLLPGIFTFWQVRLIDRQNDKIEQQNNLIDAQRKSSSIFLLGNIMDAVNNELSNDNNVDRVLSDELIGQIISLSHSVMPYKFLLPDGTTSKILSPERTQLLIFLLESNINPKSIGRILENGVFTHLYIDNYTFRDDTITGDFSNSVFGRVEFNNCKLYRAQFYDSDIDGFTFKDCRIKNLYVGAKYSGLFSINRERQKEKYARRINSISINNSVIEKSIFGCTIIGGFSMSKSKMSRCTFDHVERFAAFYSEIYDMNDVLATERINLFYSMVYFNHPYRDNKDRYHSLPLPEHDTSTTQVIHAAVAFPSSLNIPYPDWIGLHDTMSFVYPLREHWLDRVFLLNEDSTKMFSINDPQWKEHLIDDGWNH